MKVNKFLYQTYRYSLIICKSKDNKFLTVQEKNGQWWIPGGKVQKNQTFLNAAKRQCFQETSLNIKIKGLIRVDYGTYAEKNALRAIFYAQPEQDQKDQNQMIKAKQDQESKQAKFLSIKQIQQIKPKWRGRQIFDFPSYILNGGPVFPLQILKQNFKHDQKMI